MCFVVGRPLLCVSLRHVTLVTSLTTGSHVTTRKLQFAEEGPTLRVESYELSQTLRTFNKFYHSLLLFDECLLYISDSELSVDN